jgi:hypothetical protein
MFSLSDEEICLEHKPQGISHVKRLIMTTNDQLIDLLLAGGKYQSGCISTEQMATHV